MRRQCFSTLRDRAIFSFSLVHTGDVSCSFARSCFTCMKEEVFLQASDSAMRVYAISTALRGLSH